MEQTGILEIPEVEEVQVSELGAQVSIGMSRVTDGISSVEIAGILQEDVDFIWEKISPYVEKALSYTLGEVGPFGVYTALLAEHMQLWLAFNEKQLFGFVITEVLVHNVDCKECNMRIVGGTQIERWISPMVTQLEAWATELHCDYISGTGRMGWSKYMKTFGYQFEAIKAAKRLRKLQ